MLRAAAASLNKIRGTARRYRIEQLPAENETAFSYDLSKMRKHLLYGEELTPFEDGVRAQMAWLMERANRQ